MTSKIDDLKDKISELRVELKEKDDLWYDMWCKSNPHLTPEISDVLQSLGENMDEIKCWIEYYKAELKDLETNCPLSCNFVVKSKSI